MKKRNTATYFGICLLSTFLLSGSLAFAFQPGALDPTFGNSGTQLSEIPEAEGGIPVIQADGKIVVAGSTSYNCSTGFCVVVAKYLVNGNLDSSFGVKGLSIASMGTGPKVLAVALDQNGKILVAGSTTWTAGGAISNGEHFALVRFNSMGSLDTSFGIGGMVVTPMPVVGGNAQISSIADIAVQADGKIVAVGRAAASVSGAHSLAAVRYDSMGKLDPSFGTGGIILGSFGSVDCFGKRVRVQSDGKIVFSGYISSGSGKSFVARFGGKGELDMSFGDKGIATNSSYSTASALAIQSDGKIVTGGYFESYGFPLMVSRYNADGSLDNGFGNSGNQIGAHSNYYPNVSSVLVQSNGKIVLIGTIVPHQNNSAFAVVRFTPAGALDSSFGNAGVVTTQVGTYTSGLGGAIQSDGKIVVTGSDLWQPFTNYGYRPGFALMRLQGDPPQVSAHTIFVTSTLQSGSLGGLSGGDALCSTRAAAGSKTRALSGKWRAILSSTSLSAKGRITLNSGAKIVNTKGEIVANAGTDLWNPLLLVIPRYDENGADAGSNNAYAWTGSKSGGLSQGASMDCNSWSSANPTAVGAYGLTAARDGNWLFSTTSQCAATLRLYCISE